MPSTAFFNPAGGVSCHEELEGHLILRSLHGVQDIDRFAEFNATYNDEKEGRSCACLLRYQPRRTFDDAWLVEDAGQVVATVCLIPWTCRYGALDLRVAMLEMVLAHPDYRGRGLVAALIRQFHKRVEQQQYDMTLIWGIPYFYRQFGYGYAVGGDVRESLPGWQIPVGAAACRLRPANLADIPRLLALHSHLVSSLDTCIVRDAVDWEYLLRHARHPIEMLVDNASEEVCGYVSIVRSASRLDILECSIPAMGDALALLHLLRQADVPEVQVAWPPASTLVQLVRTLGSQTLAGNQWLWRIPHLAHLLGRIAPVLEQRLHDSPWRGLSEDLILNTYREAHILQFSGGKLVGVHGVGFVDSSMGADGGHLCIPPEALLRLILGCQRLVELTDAWPDIIVKPHKRNLFETLFPGMRSYLYTPYHYLG